MLPFYFSYANVILTIPDPPMFPPAQHFAQLSQKLEVPVAPPPAGQFM